MILNKLIMKKILYSLLLFFFFPVLIFSQNEQSSENEINEAANKFKILLQTAVKYYKDSVNIKKISEAGYTAMLKDLDPFSVYFGAEEYKKINDIYKGSTLSTGLSIISLNDTITITNVSKPSPASDAGILAGDKILFIGGQSALKMNGNDALAKLNQSPDTTIIIIVKRGYSDSFKEYVLKKREVTIPTITASFIIPNTDIAYIKFIKFSAIADDEFRQQLSSLKSKGMKSLILDLRNNSGGYLEQVVRMADELLPGQDTITYTKARAKEFLYTHTSKDGSEFERLPVMVIIDGNSASASEILAGSLQDLDRGLVVGTTSFGKGSVQKLWEFKDGSAFRITVASYFTPSGRSIQKSISKEQVELPASAKLTMSENAQKSIEDMILKTGGKSKLPTYKTLKGRTVLGGGGIFPDYFVNDDTTTKLSQVYKSNGLYLEFSLKYLIDKREDIIKKYDNDYLKFNENFTIDETTLNSFITYSKAKNVWNDKMYQTDKSLITAYLKAYINYSLWGDSAYYLALLPIDKQIKKAIEILPEAKKMIN